MSSSFFSAADAAVDGIPASTIKLDLPDSSITFSEYDNTDGVFTEPVVVGSSVVYVNRVD